MDYDDFEDDFEDDVGGSFPNKQDEAESNLDLFNFRDPVNSYLFLSDDVQDELESPLNRKLKCLLCGHKFIGRKTDHCPICYGAVFGEMI